MSRNKIGPDGFTLVEVLITLAIFSILTAGIYSAYSSQIRHHSREYRVAGSEVELLIAGNLLERDLTLAGFGYPEDFGNMSTSDFPDGLPARTVQGGGGSTVPDELHLYGTGLSIKNVSSQRWMYQGSAGLQFPSGASERLQGGDFLVAIEPNGRKLLDDNGEWLFKFDGTSLLHSDGGSLTNPFPTGTLFYGLKKAPTVADQPGQPFYAVHYYLGGTSPSICAPTTQSLQRDESDSKLLQDNYADPNPMLSCVLDFQVGFELDTNGDGGVDQWANEGGLSTYTAEQVRKNLKRINAYVLVQVGGRDQDYTYPDGTIWVGDEARGIGREVTFTDDQRKYRWRVISVKATPRNLR